MLAFLFFTRRNGGKFPSARQGRSQNQTRSRRHRESPGARRKPNPSGFRPGLKTPGALSRHSLRAVPATSPSTSELPRVPQAVHQTLALATPQELELPGFPEFGDPAPTLALG